MKPGRELIILAGIAPALFLISAPYVPQGLQPADAGEFQLVARELGVAHPPGYPAYTMAAHTFGRVIVALWPGRLPLDVAWPYAINLFSTALAFATLAVVALAGRKVSGSWKGALITVVVLGTCPTFVSLALVANIRMATALLTALVLLAAIVAVEKSEARASETSRSDAKGLVGLGIAFGLAAGHHPSLVFLAPPIFLALVAAGALRGLPLPALVCAAFASGLAWLIPQIYLPLRDAAGAVLSPGDLTDAAALLRFVTGTAFRSDLIDGAGAVHLLDRARVVFDVHLLQFGAVGLSLVALGLTHCVGDRRRWPVAILLGGSALSVAVLAVVYRAPQTVEYLMPAYVALAILASASVGAFESLVVRLRRWSRAGGWSRGGGLGRAERLGRGERRSDDERRMIPTWASLLIVASVVFSLIARAGLAGLPAAALEAVPRIDPIIERALEVADCSSTRSDAPLPADTSRTDQSPAIILAAWHWATPLWLAADLISSADTHSTADSRSTDDIRYVAPDWETGDPIGVTWIKHLDLSSEDGRVILTNRTQEIIDADRPLWPIRDTPFWSVEPDGGCAVGGAPGKILSAGTATGASVSLDTERTAVTARDGFAEAWIVFGGEADHEAEQRTEQRTEQRSAPLTEPLSISVRLVDPVDGRLWAQVDRTASAARWNDDRGLIFRLPLIPFAGDVPDTLEARLGLYQHSPDGPRPVPWSDGSESAPIGSVETKDGSRPVPPPGVIPFGDAMLLESSAVSVVGGAIRVDLVWRAVRAYRSDLTISVHVEGDGWRLQHDGTPALGAIPTLKWLPGWRVRDRHSIALPPDAAPDAPVTISVAVYDAFSLEPLPVTDAVLVENGEGERVTIYSGALPE